jgi:hypothetical protein
MNIAGGIGSRRNFGIKRLGQTPIHDQNFPEFSHHDVLWLQIPMQNMVSVCERNGIADLLKDPQTLGYTSELISILVEPAALHQLHGVEDAAIHQSADIVHRNNSRMFELCDYFCLAQQVCT